MRKYIISILIATLIVTLGVYQVQSQIEIQNKNILNKSVEDKQNITSCNTIQKPEPINPDIAKEEENNNYIIMQATAYDLSVQCCGKSYSSPSRGITRDGFNLNNKSHSEAWTVSSNKFSLGTKLRLKFSESHKNYSGIYTVRDTGNFNENVLDVYIGDFGEHVYRDTINFGRVDVKVGVVE